MREGLHRHTCKAEVRYCGMHLIEDVDAIAAVVVAIVILCTRMVYG